MAGTLLINYSGVLGGAERVLLDFAEGLGGSPILACPEGPLAAAARDRGVWVLPQPMAPIALRGSAGRRLAAAAALAEHAARVRALTTALEPELVVLCGMRSILAALGAGPLPAPVIADHHDLLPGWWIAVALRRALRRAAVVVVPSRAVAEDLRCASPVRVVAPGVVLERFDPELAPPAAGRRC